MDTEIVYFLNNLTGKSDGLDALFVFFASYLEYCLGALLLYFLIWKKNSVKAVLLSLGAAIISDLVLVELIKNLLKRPRPFLTQTVNQLISASGYSFPSGHAAAFFAMAAVLFCYDKKLGTGFLVASFLISLSRVVIGVHYLSDILAGALLGVLVGLGFCLISAKIFQSHG